MLRSPRRRAYQDQNTMERSHPIATSINPSSNQSKESNNRRPKLACTPHRSMNHLATSIFVIKIRRNPHTIWGITLPTLAHLRLFYSILIKWKGKWFQESCKGFGIFSFSACFQEELPRTSCVLEYLAEIIPAELDIPSSLLPSGSQRPKPILESHKIVTYSSFLICQVISIIGKDLMRTQQKREVRFLLSQGFQSSPSLNEG